MHRLTFYVLWLFLVIFTLAAAPLQGDTPPPPQPTPTPGLLETCLDEGLGKCLTKAFREGGWWLLLAVAILVLAVVLLLPYLQGWLEAWKKRGEKAGEEFLGGDDFSATTRLYLEKVIEDYRRFTLRGLGGRARDIDPPQLDQAFVSLRIVPEVQRDQERLPGRMKEKGPAPELFVTGEEGLADMTVKAEAIELSEAFALAPRLAIVGVAGSGKTTLLQWVGLAMARSLLKQTKDLKPDQKALIQKVNRLLLPVLIPLREYNRNCLEKKLDRTARTLLDFIPFYIAGRHPTLNLSIDFFAKHLKQGSLLKFDGVDEVALSDRPLVRAAIEQLLRDLKDTPTRCLVTSRSYAYFGPAQLAEGFVKAEVQPLTSEQRVDLLHNWYRAIYHGDLDRASAASEDLLKRIDTADRRVQDLARTPLMATIFAIVHQEGGELPRQRAELYEKCVNFLLTEPHHKEDEAGRSLQDWGGVDPTFRLKRLAYIAFHTLAFGQRGDAILEDDLLDLLWSEFRGAADKDAARAEARAFIRLVADRGGLLEEQDGRYGFYTHRTFREYLAGRYLAEEMGAAEQRDFLAEKLADDSWEEPVLLAAGFLAIGGERRPNEFLNMLAGLGEDVEGRARALGRALLALADLTPQSKRDDRVYPETRDRLNEMALAALSTNPPGVPVRLRDTIGRALGRAGDPRLDPLDPPMVAVPAGSFHIGTNPEDERLLKEQEAKVWDDEKPAHLVTLSDFEIGLYPLTNAEFHLFWDEGGYDRQELWSPDGWRWRTGAWEPDLSIYPEDYRERVREWLAGRPVERRDCPFWWDDPQWNSPNLPVVGVSWFEAEAYCNWLSQKTGRHYSLPTEAQWEKAARASPLPLAGEGSGVGADGLGVRLWPWGDTWDAQECNNYEGEDKIGQTTPVGIYPDGASPYGALDMAGNVWEWCQDWYDADEYARRAESPVIDPQGPEIGRARVVRGGSWHLDRLSARCAYRLRRGPEYFYSNLGFRLVRSPV